jgi:hypothetical protein
MPKIVGMKQPVAAGLKQYLVGVTDTSHILFATRLLKLLWQKSLSEMLRDYQLGIRLAECLTF